MEDKNLVQKVCAAIDVNSFEVRGPPIPALGYAETLRGVYLQAALLAHDCIANTLISINDNNALVCHASKDIKKGEVIFYNYTDPLKVIVCLFTLTNADPCIKSLKLFKYHVLVQCMGIL